MRKKKDDSCWKLTFHHLWIPSGRTMPPPQQNQSIPRTTLSGSDWSTLCYVPTSEPITLAVGMNVLIGQAWVTCLPWSQDASQLHLTYIDLGLGRGSSPRKIQGLLPEKWKQIFIRQSINIHAPTHLLPT